MALSRNSVANNRFALTSLQAGELHAMRQMREAVGGLNTTIKMFGSDLESTARNAVDLTLKT